MKRLNNKGFSHLEIGIVVLVVVILGLIGWRIASKNTSHAGSNQYKKLGEVNWNPNVTPYYTNSKFNFYACSNILSGSKVSLEIYVNAPSYPTFIQSGHYVPGIAEVVNGKKINMHTKWNFNDVKLQVAADSKRSFDLRGAYASFMNNSNTTYSVYDKIKLGPQSTGYWPDVYTDEVEVASIPNCQPFDTKQSGGIPTINAAMSITIPKESALVSPNNVSTSMGGTTKIQYSSINKPINITSTVSGIHTFFLLKSQFQYVTELASAPKYATPHNKYPITLGKDVNTVYYFDGTQTSDVTYTPSVAGIYCFDTRILTPLVSPVVISGSNPTSPTGSACVSVQ